MVAEICAYSMRYVHTVLSTSHVMTLSSDVNDCNFLNSILTLIVFIVNTPIFSLRYVVYK